MSPGACAGPDRRQHTTARPPLEAAARMNPIGASRALVARLRSCQEANHATMHLKRIPAVVAAIGVLTAPAVALAATAGQTTASTARQPAPSARLVIHRKAVDRNVRLARILAGRTGRPFSAGTYEHHARTRPTGALKRSNSRLRAKLDRLRVRRTRERRLRAAASSVPRGLLTAIANCESHGNPRAIGGGGRYRGAYQFDYSTWRSVGGSGDPAAASMAEQTARAAILYSRVGRSAWPVCGR